MITYFLDRWLVSRRFKKANDGYIYRRRADLPGYQVSEQERQAALLAFRKRYWKSWFLAFLVTLFGVLFIAVAAMVFGLSENVLKGLTYLLVAALFAFVIWDQRQQTLQLERRFAGHPAVEAETPTGTWFSRFQHMSVQRNWFKHALLVSIYGAISWLLLPSSIEASIVQWLLFSLFAALSLLLVYGAVHKALQGEQKAELTGE